MSDKCVLTQCCCGCTLRTGALGTAIFCLIIGLINTILAVYQIIADKAQSGWFNVIVNVLVLIVAILLLHGVRKEKPRLVRIWVYVEIVLVVLILISTIVLFVRSGDWSGLFVGLINVGVMVYFLLVVRSYAIQLESGGGAANTV